MDNNNNNTDTYKNASFLLYTKQSPRVWYASGVIIFNYDITKTIIVKTPTGNIGFPKGGKERFERVHQTAHREVREETGLKGNHYKHDNTLIGEKKGNNPNMRCSIYYFMGITTDENVENFKLKCFNDYELSFVDWVLIEDACKMLTPKRQEILREAHKYVINKQQLKNQRQQSPSLKENENETKEN
jgi:8-oxo-dGTP pyrophosphatase MutT (NUDIX family)